MMITTDRVTVHKGDKVWRIVVNEIEEGEIVNTDDHWTSVRWLNENHTYAHWDDESGNPIFEVDGELFASETNAINTLIDHTVKKINEAQLLVQKLQGRIREINNEG